MFRSQPAPFSIWRPSRNTVKTDTKHTFSFFALSEDVEKTDLKIGRNANMENNRQKDRRLDPK